MIKFCRYLVYSLFSLLVLGGINDISAQESIAEEVVSDEDDRIKYLLYKINEIRTSGCRCGRKKMPKVNKLVWNKQLSYSAYEHAQEMNDFNYFSHHSRDDKDIGERLDALGYKWQYVGENLAEGQTSFDEALDDWMASKSHCTMIMNPGMKEMGVARVGKYWVHHFGTRMPPKTKRIRTHYTEGE